jgi:hypothetical protein
MCRAHDGKVPRAFPCAELHGLRLNGMAEAGALSQALGYGIVGAVNECPGVSTCKLCLAGGVASRAVFPRVLVSLIPPEKS